MRLPKIAAVAIAAIAVALAVHFITKGTAPTPHDLGAVAALAPSLADDAEVTILADGSTILVGGERSALIAPTSTETADAAANAASAGPLIEGTVIDSTGRGIPLAEVLLSDSGTLPLDVEHAGSAAFRDRLEAEADSGGAFQLVAPSDGQFRIMVSAPGFVPHRNDALTVVGPTTTLDPIVLERAVRLEGRVVDESASGIAGAELYAADRDLAPELESLGFVRRPVATTDADGRFVVDELPHGPWKLRVTAPDHRTGSFEGQTTAPGAEQRKLHFVLTAGEAIEGAIVAAPLNLVSRLEVRAVAVGDSAERPHWASVDGNGAFRLAGLTPDQPYEVQAFEAEGPSPARSATVRLARTDRRVVDAGSRGVQLTYSTGSGIVFRVIDGGTGAPVETLDVRYGTGGAAGTLRPVDPLGHFPGGMVFIDGLGARDASTPIQIVVRSKGYETFQLRDVVAVPNAEVSLGEIALEPVPILRVLVHDAATGAPLEGASVSLTPQSDSPTAAAERRFDHAVAAQWGAASGSAPSTAIGAIVRTDAAGVAELSPPRGAGAVLRVERAGYSPLEVADIAIDSTQAVSERRVELEAGGTVRVEALASDGTPLVGVRIEHRSPAEMESTWIPLPPGAGPQWTTGAEGSVTIDGLEVGVHGFRLADKDAPMRMEGPGEGGWTAAVVESGATSSLVLTRAARGSLGGTVFEGDAPLPQANLTLAPDADAGMANRAGPVLARTDVDGNFEFEEVPAGPYTLTIAHRERAVPTTVAVEVGPGVNRTAVELSSDRIWGTVAADDGTPLAGVLVTARHADDFAPPAGAWSYGMLQSAGGMRRQITRTTAGQAGDPVRTDAEGRFELRGGLADGPTVVEAWGPGVARARTAPLSAGQRSGEAAVHLTLEAAGAVRITVAESDGSLARGCIVEARSDDVDAPVVGYVALGSTVLEGLAAGAWEVTVMRQGPVDPEREPTQDVAIEAGATAELTFELP